MNTTNHSLPTTGKNSLHPILVIAAVAVVLFCGVGSAALMGWLPASSAGSAPTAALQAQEAAAQAQSPDGGSSSANQPQQLAQAGTRAPEPQRAAQPAPVCSSCGVVESINEVQQRAQGSGAGAAGGAILGGLLGNQVGSGHGRQLATVAGAIGGAVAGNQIEGNVRATHSYTIVVRMDAGQTRTFHQSSAPNWRTGDAVKVIKGQLQSA